MSEILDSWDGPVVVGGDNYHQSLQDAVEYFWDDAWDEDIDWNQVPEWAEACDAKPVYVDAEWIIEAIDNVEENALENSCAEYCPEGHIAKLDQFLREWSKDINWRIYEPIGKKLKFRELVKQYAADQNA